MSTTTFTLSDALAQYIHAHNPQEHPGLTALRQETLATNDAAPMQISQEQGHLMQLLLRLMNAKKVLEVGTFTGYSAAAMALALPDDGHITCCDSSYDWTRTAVKHWSLMGLEQKISLHINPGLKTLQSLVDDGYSEHFDFMFIDADKPNYCGYYELGMQLVRPGGLIAIDNTLWNGAVADSGEVTDATRHIRALNSLVAEDARSMHSIVPIGDGLTLALKK